MKVIKKTIRKYYKYVAESWTRPDLLWNGAMGDNFSVSASSEQTNYDRYAWKAVDGNLSTFWAAQGTVGNWFQFYSNNYLKVTNITWTPSDAYYPLSVQLWVGNSEDSLEQIYDFTYQGSTSTCVINLSDNRIYHKIYRIYSDRNFGIKEINISATQKVVQESTSSDYDFYKDVDTYNVLNSSGYKAFT